jgi:DnaJ-class molecular chaperone
VNTITPEEYDHIPQHKPKCPLCDGAGVTRRAGTGLQIQTCEVCGGEGHVLISREDS